MSYTLTADNNRLLRTATVPSNVNISVCCWIVLNADKNNWGISVGMDVPGNAVVMYLTVESSGTRYIFHLSSNDTELLLTMATATSYFVAFTGAASGGAAESYLSLAAAPSLTPGATLVNPASAPTQLWVGGGDGGDYWAGQVYNLKIWSGGTVLTPTQLINERDSYAPLSGQSYSGNLWAHYPLVSDIQDISGNLRHLGLVPTTGVLGSFTATPTGAPAPALVTWDQGHYRWRDDQASPVFLAAEDTPTTWPTLTNLRLRTLLNPSGGDPPPVAIQREWNRPAADSVYRPLEVIGGAALGAGVAGAVPSPTGSATAPIAAYPTGITKGQQLILFVANKPDTSTVTTPAGWTVLSNSSATGGAGAQAADTGVVRGTVFTKEADGTETGNLTLAITGGNSAGAKILRYTKTTGKVWSLAIVNGADNTAGTAWSATAAASPGFLAGDILLVCSASSSDTAVLGSQAVSQSGVTFGTLANRATDPVSTGNDLKVQMDEFPVNSITTPSGAPVFTMTASGTGSASVAGISLFVRIRQVDAPIVLFPSATITAGGTDNTAALLTAPGGETFGGGKLSDDTNPFPPVDLADTTYGEWETCLQATATALNGEVYRFRDTINGTPLTSYTGIPEWTIGAAVAGVLYTQLEGASGRGMFRGLAGKIA